MGAQINELITRMHTEKIDILIIGGGLCGVYAASRLVHTPQSILLVEARNRLGGRILSHDYPAMSTDLGPSWFWPDINPRVTALVRELGLESFPQFETGMGRFQGRDGMVENMDGYPMAPQGRRLKGGMAALIKGLSSHIPPDTIRLNHPVCEIQQGDPGIRVIVGQLDQPPQAVIEANQVILALPPRLAAGSILFTPDLPADLTQAMLKASTWMAGHAKFFALYDDAPWRKKGISGQGFSLCGPMGELHDASAPQSPPFGLTGFLGIPALGRKDPDTMVRAILDQLDRMYGPGAGRPIHHHYVDWARERFTATDYDQRSAHNHPEFHPPSGKTSIWGHRLHLAGTETAREFGGYLEGALVSSEQALAAVK
ncbi:MAG: FAD-dependent oxidoreductase [Desulfobacterales bacterium]|nr:FAD-dependent oxidoreductase [Desulfobacterales bacterium]